MFTHAALNWSESEYDNKLPPVVKTCNGASRRKWCGFLSNHLSFVYFEQALCAVCLYHMCCTNNIDEFITTASISFCSVFLSSRPSLPALRGHLHLEVVALLPAPSLQVLQRGLQPLTTVPGVAVLGYPADNHERLQHVDNVVDAPPLHSWQFECESREVSPLFVRNICIWIKTDQMFSVCI